jgi:hypothetical protein
VYTRYSSYMSTETSTPDSDLTAYLPCSHGTPTNLVCDRCDTDLAPGEHLHRCENCDRDYDLTVGKSCAQKRNRCCTNCSHRVYYI